MSLATEQIPDTTNTPASTLYWWDVWGQGTHALVIARSAVHACDIATKTEGFGHKVLHTQKVDAPSCVITVGEGLVGWWEDE